MDIVSDSNKRGVSIKRGEWIFVTSDLINREENSALNKRGGWKYVQEVLVICGMLGGKLSGFPVFHSNTTHIDRK